MRNEYYAGVPVEQVEAEEEYFQPTGLVPLTLQRLTQGSTRWASGVMGLHTGGCAHAHEWVAEWHAHSAGAKLCRDVSAYPRWTGERLGGLLALGGPHWGSLAGLVPVGESWVTHVWAAAGGRESQQVGPLAVDAHAVRAQALGAGGWRLETLAVSGSDAVLSAWSRGAIADAELERVAQRQAFASANLAKLGQLDEVWPQLARSPDPTRRSHLIAALPALGVEASVLMTRYANERDVSVQRALVLALGDYPLDAVPAAERLAFTQRLLRDFRTHPDAGLHGALDWLLRRRWEQGPALDAAVQAWATESKGQHPSAVVGARGWYVNGVGQTFALVRGPVESVLGSPESEPDRDDSSFEGRGRVRINRSFLLAAREVTVAEYRRFNRQYQYTAKYSPGQDTPINHVSWYEAAAYCNWLSQQEGLPATQWCYEPINGEFKEGMRLAANYLERVGYRLPTEHEWEYAARVGAVTARPHGRTETLLGRSGSVTK